MNPKRRCRRFAQRSSSSIPGWPWPTSVRWNRSTIAAFSGLREPVWVLAIFAALSALLAALGLYGVVSHSVAQQRREIGIRLALGAHAHDVLSMVVRRALTMVIVGLVIGLAGAAALTRVTSSLLFEVSALDPFAFVAAGLAMATIGSIAALIPASQATRVDPTTALRSEG